MPRPSSNRDREQGFIPLPREKPVASDIKVDGTSVKYDYLAAEFTKAISPEVGSFKIELINADGQFTDKYVGGETVQLYVDLSAGTTKKFEGKIDTIKNVDKGFEVLEIAGGHISDSLLDLTVTKEYSGTKTCDEILKEIIDEYLTGFTYSNVDASTEKPNTKWSNKPFWNCVEDLCRLAKSDGRFDCYVDDSKDFYFFEEHSKDNTDEVIWKDTTISISGFGESHVMVKNKIKIVGDDGTGLPILRQATDTTSESVYGTKEEVVVNTDINTGESAENIADALLANEKNPKDEGSANCFIFPTIEPGQRVWIIQPTMKLHQQIKVAKFTHKFPMETTDLVLYKKKNIPGVLRDQTLKDIANETIINPYEMTKSLNFTFDDTAKLSSWDSNVEVSGGKLKLSSGVVGVVTSETFSQSSDITQVQLLQVGEKLTDVVYKVSTDGGDNYQTISPEGLSDVTPGKDIILKIFINAADTEIDSIALLIK